MEPSLQLFRDHSPIVVLLLFPFGSFLPQQVSAQNLVITNGAAWNTCDGLFYDSGGPTSDYASNQNFIATLCPGGGEGSGAATVVHFLSFELDFLDGDHLDIHDGTGISDPIIASGSSNNSLAGLTFTATGPTGCLTFHWVSNVAINGPGWEAEVLTGPNAGINASLTLCSSQPAFPLVDALNGDPDVGGFWTGPGGSHSAQFDPAIDSTGTYTYTVIDGSLCVDSASVTINNVQAPDPGGDAFLLICDVSGPVDLLSSLSGTPDPGGTWAGPGGPNNGIFDPGTDDPGDYTYTVGGNLPCPNESATVTVVLTGPPDAGTNGNLLACDTIVALDLFSGLGGTPDVGGIWADLDNTGALTGGTVNTNGLQAGSYTFQYTVNVAGCGTDNALVTVQVLAGVSVSDVLRRCRQSSGTSIITFTINGGDTATYVVSGVPGTISGPAPYVFTSDTIADSMNVVITVSDQNGCGPVTFTLDDCSYPPQVFVPELFSPNGDGINDTFILPGLEDFPNNEIHIYNRWGGEVFAETDYHRKTPWRGQSQHQFAPGDLPTGTYYYVLDLGNRTDLIKGYVYLER